jgi:hypothetical protein
VLEELRADPKIDSAKPLRFDVAPPDISMHGAAGRLPAVF